MGTSWISRKGGILEKGGGGVDLEKGGMTPPLPTMLLLLNLGSKSNYVIEVDSGLLHWG